MGNIALRSGFRFRRWKKATDCALGKGKGNHVKNLRMICLFEADANKEFGEIGRKCMQKAEKYETLPPEQYGGRKDHSSQDQALNKTLADDHVRQMKQPAAKMVGDLAKCYDRIEHSYAGLALQSQGLEEGPVVMLFGTLQEMEHHVRTIYGDSKRSFHSNKKWKRTRRWWLQCWRCWSRWPAARRISRRRATGTGAGHRRTGTNQWSTLWASCVSWWPWRSLLTTWGAATCVHLLYVVVGVAPLKTKTHSLC